MILGTLVRLESPEASKYFTTERGSILPLESVCTYVIQVRLADEFDALLEGDIRLPAGRFVEIRVVGHRVVDVAVGGLEPVDRRFPTAR